MITAPVQYYINETISTLQVLLNLKCEFYELHNFNCQLVDDELFYDIKFSYKTFFEDSKKFHLHDYHSKFSVLVNIT